MKIYSTRKLYAAGILPRPSSTEDVVQLAERLRALRLSYAADQLTELVTQSVKAAWSSARFLDEIIRLELERQEERRIKQALRISHLPNGPTISNFDFAYQPSVVVASQTLDQVSVKLSNGTLVHIPCTGLAAASNRAEAAAITRRGRQRPSDIGLGCSAQLELRLNGSISRSRSSNEDSATSGSFCSHSRMVVQSPSNGSSRVR